MCACLHSGLTRAGYPKPHICMVIYTTNMHARTGQALLLSRVCPFQLCVYTGRGNDAPRVVRGRRILFPVAFLLSVCINIFAPLTVCFACFSCRAPISFVSSLDGINPNPMLSPVFVLISFASTLDEATTRLELSEAGTLRANELTLLHDNWKEVQ